MSYRSRRRVIERRAQDLATTLAHKGACAEHSQLWSVAEREHQAATTKWTARCAAAPALERCQECPVLELCAEWAELDEYTGLAAGSAWIDGEERPAEWPRTHRYRQEARRRRQNAS